FNRSSRCELDVSLLAMARLPATDPWRRSQVHRVGLLIGVFGAATAASPHGESAHRGFANGPDTVFVCCRHAWYLRARRVPQRSPERAAPDDAAGRLPALQSLLCSLWLTPRSIHPRQRRLSQSSTMNCTAWLITTCAGSTPATRCRPRPSSTRRICA